MLPTAILYGYIYQEYRKAVKMAAPEANRYFILMLAVAFGGGVLLELVPFDRSLSLESRTTVVLLLLLAGLTILGIPLYWLFWRIGYGFVLIGALPILCVFLGLCLGRSVTAQD